MVASESNEEFYLLEKARELRNALTDLRTPMHEELPESRSFREGPEPHEVAEGDAGQILEVVFRLIEWNASVGNYVSNILTKLQVADRAQAIIHAREADLG